MNSLIYRFVRNKSGSAAVMVLSVIMILTVLGTVALMGSVSSIKFGSRYKNWTSEFYELDMQAESIVSEIDNELKLAEQAARSYMESEAFKDDSYEDTYITEAAQSFFHSYWDSLPNKTYDAFIPDYLAAHPSADADEISEAYSTLLKDIYEDYYEKVYLYYAANRLKAYISAHTNVTEKVSGTVNGLSTLPGAWEDYGFGGSDITLNITVTDPVDVKKSVKVAMNVIYPEYKTVVQNAFRPVKGNPLWGYALAAGGGITAAEDTGSAQIKVSGDIAASGGDLRLNRNSRLEVYGNIYVNGDVGIYGDSAVLRAYNHKTSSTLAPGYDKKRSFYGNNELGIDEKKFATPLSSFSSLLASLIEPVTGPAVPLFYRDLWQQGWGNVYCRNLMINDNVSGANLAIHGNVTTLDDIEMNGLQNNTISIGTDTIKSNYVGISSEGAYITGTETIDPNLSSTIFNNQVLNDITGVDLNNRINLYGGIIVPGTAFREFDGSAPDKWYQTIESVTGRDRAIFDSYIADTDDVTANIYSLTSGEDTYTYPMKSFSSAIEQRRQELLDFLSFSSVITNIFATPDIKGYSPGAIITHSTGSPNANVYMPGTNPAGGSAAYTVNEVNWNEAKASSKLLPYFEAKTKHFGFYNKTMSDLVDETIVNQTYIDGMAAVNMYYLTGNQSFEISGKSGIIYCTGNLTLRGDGTGNGLFNGIILAKGDIILDPSAGGFTVIYDESIISSIISDEKASAVRAFFEDGMIGINDYTFIKDFSAAGATKTYLKRYSIRSWQEVQEP